METLIGTIHSVIYENTKNDFKVFLIRRKDKALIKVTGEFSHILPGAKVEVHGNYKNHPKYGISFKAEAYTFDYNNNVKSIGLYIQSIAKWVGPDRANAIAQAFGEDIEEIITKTPERLTEIDGIGKKVAQNIAEAWDINRTLKDIKIFLHGLGLTPNKIKRIITTYGSETERILTEDPWLLCLNGFGFTTADYIASKLGKNMSCIQRYKHFISYVLSESFHNGHLFLNPTQIIAAFNKYNKKAQSPFKSGNILIDDLVEPLKQLINEGYIVKEENKLYDLQSYFFENESARIIAKIHLTPDTCKLSKFNVIDYVARYEKQHKINLSDAQREAVELFVKEKVLIITGNPGTGKTTVVKALVQIMTENGIQFELLTPTGIAAKKLGDTALTEAMTIHRRLGYRGDEWQYNCFEKYNTQVVVVDESSMVDQEVFYRLVSAIHPSTKIVFVGDNDQLPSVGPGNVLAELIKSSVIKTIKLTKIFRQEKCSEIILEAKRIRDGDTNLEYFRQDKNADIWHIKDDNPDRIESFIIKAARRLKDKKKHFQIITPRNEGPLSVDTLNISLQEALNPASADKKEIYVNRSVVRKGDRVLIRKNNYELNVYNGDIGKIVNITSDYLSVDVEDFMDATRRVDIPLKFAEDMIKLAYTVTVHKAQGTEYPLVMIPLIKAHGDFLLQRNLLYTAVTRAKKKVIIIGQASAIEKSIINDKIQKRNTLFSERIKGWIRGEGITLQKLFSTISSSQTNQHLKRLLSLEATISWQGPRAN